MTKISVNFENVLKISTELNLDVSKTLLHLKSNGVSLIDVDFERLSGENSYMKDIIISGVAIGSVISACPLFEKDNLQKALSMIDLCAEYKIKEITILPKLTVKDKIEEQIFNLKQNLRRIVKYAENFGVIVALKNDATENYPVKTTSQTLDVIKSVKGLRFVFDGGNYINSNENVVDASKLLAPYTQRYIIKDYINGNGECEFVTVGSGRGKCRETFNIIKEFYPKIPLVIEIPLSCINQNDMVINSATYVLTEIL